MEKIKSAEEFFEEINYDLDDLDGPTIEMMLEFSSRYGEYMFDQGHKERYEDGKLAGKNEFASKF